MSELTLFNYDSDDSEYEVRVVVVNGEPWWIATDVCRVLGISNTSDAVRRLDSQDIDRIDILDARNVTQQAWAINEPGLYELVIRSNKPSARAFRRWITSEVLPTIRKTGSYSLVPQSLPEALRAYANEVEARETAERALAAAQPKIEVYDDWLTSNAVEMTDFAKRIGFTPVIRFTATLRAIDVLRCDKTHTGRFRNLPTADWEYAFDVRPHRLPNDEWIDLALVNPTGQHDLRELLRDHGYDV
jgi:prophage antirepressor-like protein